MRPRFFLVLIPFLLSSTVHANDDSRVGTVVDRQGTALVRPVGRERWTPIGPRSILMPGDQVRTPTRGANAVEVRLVGKRRLVMGPGCLIEIPDKETVKLYRGDLEAKGELKLMGPGKYSVASKGTILLRSDGQQTEKLKTAPRWLTGYRSSTTDEWMGSLIATVDGRNVPLSVGYHKVTVDIRDQIARTTVEQSFVNSTDVTLEGVFYFPLPADASISSFGMWIGNELVEADIVEKQRARAIYEDILRKRKDPGLLEWSGGNLFKARVFPIFAHSEKRIRIQYTQVLPLEGSTVRYRYALRSELLRARPLRQLQIRVHVSSSMPITSFESPSHEVRARKTEHAASAEFDAEEYSPERDFELRIGLDRSRALSVVPHLRDEDGYFMLLLSPPGADDGEWQRELMPETDPIDLIVVADTSGSMDPAARAAQTGFVDALLSLLGPKDRFRLMTCDITTRWYRPDALPVTEENSSAAVGWLDERASLGWTDLDRAFADVGRIATANTVIVYVGDGIGTTGDADPVALAERIRAAGKGVCHAIYTSSTYEKGVLEAIASVGGGSVRSAAGEPFGAAYGLLSEAAQPAVKDVQVKFEGLRTARVYPERLPNLPAGTQQIVLGRFLPTKGDQTGRITVTGTLDGKPVRYSTTLTIKGDEAGNSFLPRLWARRHLDALLAQGRTPAIKKEIVSFSEEYGIMTPFTSFLVLESDAQREEYGVTRRVRMRDGERFFAEGRDNASTELLQQQMKLARTWRLRLRAAMLREIATLGRNLHEVAFGGQINLIGTSSNSPLFGGQSEEARDFREIDHAKKSVEEEEEPADDASYDDEDVELEALEKDAPPASPAAKKRSSDSKLRRQKFRGLAGGGRGWAGRPSRTVLPASPYPFLFPSLQPPPGAPEAQPDPKWPARVMDLMRSIDRRTALAALPGGIRIAQHGGTRHAANGHATSNEHAEGLYGHSGWFVRTRRGHTPVYDDWLAKGRVGILDVGLRLGREREAATGDRTTWPFPLADHSFEDMVRNYRTYTAEWKDGIVILRSPAPGKTEMRLRFDAEKRVLTEWITLVNGKKTSTTRWSEFTQVGGLWWATRIEQFDAKDRLIRRSDRKVEALEPDAFAKALTTATAGHDDAILLPRANPTVKDAKQAAHDKRAGFAEYFALTLHFVASQQWDRVFENWGRAEALAQGKPGASWLRAELLVRGRRAGEAKNLVSKLGPPSAGPAQHAVAQHTIDLAQRVFQANEMLVLLESLKPALPDVDYLRLLAKWLNGASQTDRALEVWTKLAEQRPYDMRDVSGYLNALRAARRLDDAIALSRTSIDRGKWLAPELDQLFASWTDLLWYRRDIKQLHDVLLRWIEARPENEGAYQRYVSTLVFLGRENDADAWSKKQLAGAPGPSMGAAIRYALGQGWNFSTNRVEEQWWKPLGTLGLRLVRGDEKHWQLGARILNHRRFMQTDAAAALRAAMLDDVTAPDTIETLPLPRLVRYLSLLHWNRDSVDEATWRKVTDRLKARFESAPDDPARRTLATRVLRLLDARRARDEAIDFLRRRKQTPEVARQLATRLHTLAWTAKIEAELFALLKVLQPEEAQDDARMRTAGLEVRKLVAQLETMRYTALLGPTEKLEKLPRAQRRRRQRIARVESHKAFAAALAIEKSRADRWSAPWMELERLCFMAQTATGDVNGNTRELFGSAKDILLRERCAYVLAYIATRRKAPDGLADQVVAFLNAQEGEQIDWHAHIFRLLIALSRNEQLQATLKEWITPADAESRWRVALGYLYAEQGRLDEAVSAFEAVARADELRPAEYEALANWLLVLDRKQKREDALLQRYRVMQEQQISQRIWQEYYKVARNSGNTPPREFDPDTSRALRALFEKASYPANYTYLVRSLYRTTKDFRILECLPNGAIGHTPQGVYPFLQSLTSILQEVHEEATCDAFAARVHELQKSARTDLDRRALLLLLSLVERRASEVLNAPGPHVRKGIRAMKDAFSGEWLPGERRLMASWLASLGKIPNDSFSQTRMNQLIALQRAEPAGTPDRLWISHHLGQTQWIHQRTQAAIDTLTVAIDEYKQSRGGLTQEAHQALGTLVNWLNTRGFHRVAETRIEAAIKAAAGRTQRMWLQRLLFTVYNHAVRNRGSVSFGRGRALYDGARKRMERAMWRDGPDQVAATLGSYCYLHDAARKSKIAPDAGGDLEQFAKTKFPELLSTAMTDRNSLVQTVAGTLYTLRGPSVALGLLIVQMENEPAWLEKVGRDGWRSFGWNLSRWRSEAGDIGPLTPRLLKLATRALENDLMLLRSPRNGLYRASSSHFWHAQAPAFRAVALKVVETNPDSSALLLHAAGYLWGGLREFDLAIRTLLAAEARGKLHEGGRWKLVRWLHDRHRWKESLPQLEKLLAERPDHRAYVLAHIRALHESGRDNEAREQIDAAEKRFKELKQWNEIVLSSLAPLAGECRFHQRAVKYYEELIPLHQRTHRKRGVGGGTLSSYYAGVSKSYLGLRQVDKAVDAASAAVVSWGRSRRNRTRAIASLLTVLSSLKDLDGYASRYDQRVAKTGLDAPLIRKGIGAAYLGRHQPRKAIPHLLAARDLQPDDGDVHRYLLSAYDAMGEAGKAIAALMDGIRMAPMNLDLYADLGKRFEKRGRKTEAERAWTTLVEVLPNEAASHRRLAEHLEQRDDARAAVVQWRQVVRVRTGEPDGWLRLAAAQIAANDKPGARETVGRILDTTWADKTVHAQASALLR